MLKACVIGASGYTGAELARILTLHPKFELAGLFVSQNSQDANKALSQLHPSLSGLVDTKVLPINDGLLSELADSLDAIFLATPHEASHDWMPILTAGKAKIFDLSGAFRIKDADVFADFYGFAHQHKPLLEKAVYGLAEWNAASIAEASLVAVPGCYPTASLSALKPLFNSNLLDSQHRPIINAVSGVSGAGRKAALGNSYCEVSLQAYGVLGHRHQPEISQALGTDVIFTPHLGNFKRGILATITVKTVAGTSKEQVSDAYQKAYSDKPIIRLLNHFPKLDDVVNTAHCDLHWKLDEKSGYLVIGSAIDNLLKGAASQAIQCANLSFGFASPTGLIAEVSK
ncbi:MULTISPECIES: N-acetyl-gamma-glutamyl-phosphate reductase [Alteromonadaceae]|uniref:N-acetyl-gamma-glutamyl-phosphate reductase n=1 Tax=Alteromonadaceae TaxID=72275 RepID=UPI001C0A651A|nr:MULTISPECIES: N-acetyl-gamma-glutamyl-phosphate reductase [Aliiglaciecola]MBU2878518.1 N-acetyl-gamma-glutamyl-phosphate reductase [Aliiglaciecola lipolytica]MDO6709654.1 N-acetyl-gamma-glutamyl-phosphate reductase [Aliiglaciecola sp. 2_MG-2023]MDO6750804.1 N-acetyl-gamma-glutamyl-phosphate reductase [Aliiglaciecola sp. 1_MG-2023]